MIDIGVMTSGGLEVTPFNRPSRFHHARYGSFAQGWEQMSVDHITYFGWERLETRGLVLWKNHCEGRTILVLTQQT